MVCPGNFVLKQLAVLIRMIPFRSIIYLSKLLGSIAYLFDFKHRKLSLMNLDIAFPRMAKKKKKEISRKHFINLFRTALEFFSLGKVKRENYKNFITHKGLDNFANAQEKGKGIILLAAHFGNWELMAYVHPFNFAPASYLARKFKDKNVDEFINKIRFSNGNKFIDKRNALFKVLKELKKGNAIGVLMDQSVHPNEAVYVDFFGKFISTTPFIAQVALKTGCAVVPVFDFPQKDGKHIVEYFPQIEMEKPETDVDPVIYNTEKLNKFLEKIILKGTEYWLWSHNRWKNISEERCWGRVKKKEDMLEKYDNMEFVEDEANQVKGG